MKNYQSRWNSWKRVSVFVAYVSLLVNNFLPILYIAPAVIRAQEIEISPTEAPTSAPTILPTLTSVPEPTSLPTTPVETLIPVETPTNISTELPTEVPASPTQTAKSSETVGMFASSSGQTVNNVACLADRPGQSNLQCTANDISIAAVSNVTINGHGCRYPGDVVNFTATWSVQSSASSRYNVGLWFASNGQTSALNGTCSATSLPSSSAPFFDNGGGDSCGDIHSGSTGNLQITMDAVCNPDESGFLKLPYCTTWQQNESKSTPVCNGPEDTLSGSPSKCNCSDGISVPIEVPASIEVEKILNPTNDSGLFNLQIGGTTFVTNIGNTGTTGKQTVSMGTNIVGETAGSNTSLSNYESQVECRDSKGALIGTTGTGPWTLNVAKSQDVKCVITNTRKITKGTLTLEKIVVNNYGGVAKIADFAVSIGNTVVSWGVGTSLEAGSYQVTETNLPGTHHLAGLVIVWQMVRYL